MEKVAEGADIIAHSNISLGRVCGIGVSIRKILHIIAMEGAELASALVGKGLKIFLPIWADARMAKRLTVLITTVIINHQIADGRHAKSKPTIGDKVIGISAITNDDPHCKSAP
jgi:hypothetical protein